MLLRSTIITLPLLFLAICIGVAGVEAATPPSPVAHVIVTRPILQLCPTGQATGQVEVVLLDAERDTLPIEGHRLTFHSTNDAVATVDTTGLVTAIAPPQYHWQTPYIEVWADGLMADGFAVVRVTATDLGVVHREYAAQHVSFFLVPMIEGVNLDSLTAVYQVVQATDQVYEAQDAGVGYHLANGSTQYLVLDVAEDPATGICGVSGLPIRLGWLWGQPANNSCYIANDPQNRVPQWFVMWHELGHNFTSSCNSFNLFCMGPSGTHNFAYHEGFASLAAMWSWKYIGSTPGSLGSLALNDIERDLANKAGDFRSALQTYQDAGADYGAIDPNIVDGVLMEMYDLYGVKAWFDLFSTFLPHEAPLPLPLDTIEKQATWVVAAMSASSGQDLRGMFADEYGFPLDQAAWPEILNAVQSRISARPWAPTGVEAWPGVEADSGPSLTAVPNPFRDRTAFHLARAGAGLTRLRIYDLTGRLVTTLRNAPGPADERVISWDGRNDAGRSVAAGVYLARMTTIRGAASRKVLLLR